MFGKIPQFLWQALLIQTWLTLNFRYEEHIRNYSEILAMQIDILWYALNLSIVFQ